MGVVDVVVFFHWRARLGVPLPSTTTFRADVPLLLPTNTQVEPSAGFVQVVGWVSTWPPWGTLMTGPTSPPVKPGPPCPLRSARFNRRSLASLPLITARSVTFEPAGAFRMAGASGQEVALRDGCLFEM